jgi:hypothetical protein
MKNCGREGCQYQQNAGKKPRLLKSCTWRKVLKEHNVFHFSVIIYRRGGKAVLEERSILMKNGRQRWPVSGCPSP